MLTSRLPRVPRALGVANHIVRPLYARHPRAPLTVRTLGRDMTLDPHQHVDAMLLFAPHLVDYREIRFLRQYLPRGGSFLDAGAYLGFYTLQLAERVGSEGTVIAVEPDDNTANRLRQHLDRNRLGWVRTSTVPLTARGEGVSLRLDRPDNAGSRRAVSGGDLASERLVDLMERTGVERFDAIKLDLEGRDEEVLTQTLDTLPRTRWPRAIVVEEPRSEQAIAGRLEWAGYRVRRSSRLNLTAWVD